ncbi:uncharacterized protein LOC108677719 isoform X2 [Hyalella azteca]|uniref:Uncharacterized protein LOC108677719 isoform X2 n=1 Tax=Hyalella azteca TaxID=294128 RepID=A0A979FX31_HYAAZ|nr:uncharacterized protein LOC108677719 isoform X2 [Hyalella azteca]
MDNEQQQEMIYFIPDLFKPDKNASKEMVDANDPFISEEAMNVYCRSLLHPNLPPGQAGPHVGLDTPQSLGPKFFAKSIKIHQERLLKDLEDEAAELQAQEERLKKEALVKKKLDENVSKVVRKQTVYVKRSCPVKIPYKSRLTHDEHALYLMAFLKYQARPPRSFLEQQEYQAYLSLQSRVFEEQQAMMDFAKKVAILQLSDYNEVPPVMEEYIKRYLKVGYARVLDYPRIYHVDQEIPLRPQDPQQVFSSLSFQHLGHLLSLGVVPWIKLPYPHIPVTLPSDEAFLDKHPPDAVNMGKARSHGRYLCKTTVSKDPNCEFLARQHRAHVVLTPSALQVLVDNPAPSFDKEWDIPVTIHSFPVEEADGSTAQHRVVFIDKPIKRKLWTPLEKKVLFYKKSALAALTSYRSGEIFRMMAPSVFHHYGSTYNDYRACEFSYEPSLASGAVDARAASPARDTREPEAFPDNPFGPVSEEEEVDVFSERSSFYSPRSTGSNASPHPERGIKRKQPESLEKVIQPNSSSPREDSSCSQEEKVNSSNASDDPDNYLGSNSPKAGVKVNPEVNTKIMWKNRRVGDPQTRDVRDNKTPWHDRLRTDWSKHKQIRTPPPSTTTNYHYHLYKLACGAPPVPGRASPAPLTVLVRNHLHGISMERNKANNTFKSSSYVVFPKLEHQVFFGCEVNSHTEIVHQWAQLLCRPNSQLLQVRACSKSGEVVLAEERDLSEVVREGALPYIRFQPAPLLTSLYVTLDTLRRKPPGSYLLHHHNRSEAFIRLMRMANDDCLSTGHVSVFDLHASYGYSGRGAATGAAVEGDGPEAGQLVLDSRQFVNPPWLAIDTLVPTPFHLKHLKIPGTFPMDNPKKKITKKRKRLIKMKAKDKKGLFDSPEKPSSSKNNESSEDDSF